MVRLKCRHATVMTVLTVLMPTRAAPATVARAGDSYILTRTMDGTSSDNSTMASTGSTHDDDVLIERVTTSRPDGVELEYDLPTDTSSEARASQWQFPVRILEPTGAQARLLDRPAIEARLAAWLKAAALTPAACGHWVFTWNAFRIECDPESVLTTVQSFDPGSGNIREGASFIMPGAIGPAVLTRVAGTADRSLTATFTVNPDAVRQQRAKADLVMAEMSGQPLTPAQTQSAHADDVVAGTINVTFLLDAAGQVQERRTVTHTTVTRAATPVERRIGNTGPINETRTVTEVVTRRLIRTALPAPPPAGSVRGVSTRPD